LLRGEEERKEHRGTVERGGGRRGWGGEGGRGWGKSILGVGITQYWTPGKVATLCNREERTRRWIYFHMSGKNIVLLVLLIQYCVRKLKLLTSTNVPYNIIMILLHNSSTTKNESNHSVTFFSACSV
jgi:hypothetical protein